jgi:ATP-dependent Clp protease protease subunit
MQYNQANSNTTNRRNDEGEDEEKQPFPFFDMQKKPYRQYDQTFTCQHVHFYLSEGIGEPNNYTDMIYRISAASAADTIFIHLNTPGGQLDTGVQIINAMQNSQGKIVTILEGMAYSLGTLIFLAGDEMVVNDHCMMMFHNFNSGLIGKGNELTSQLDATVKWFAALAKNIYIPFLSEPEFERIVRGEDLWMHSQEIRTRLENMVKSMQQQAEREEKQVKAEEKRVAKAEKTELLQKPVSKRGRPIKPK